MALVALTRPYLVRLYQYCSSHHAGEMMSVTDRGFFGGVRKRCMGVRVSLEGSTVGSGSGLSLEGRDATRRFSQRVSHVVILRRNSQLTGEGRSVALCVLQLDRRLRLLSSRFESVARAVEPDNGGRETVANTCKPSQRPVISMIIDYHGLFNIAQFWSNAGLRLGLREEGIYGGFVQVTPIVTVVGFHRRGVVLRRGRARHSIMSPLMSGALRRVVVMDRTRFGFEKRVKGSFARHVQLYCDLTGQGT